MVGQLGRGEAEVERARRRDVDRALHRAGPAGEPALLLGRAAQVRERRGREPAVDLVERASGPDRGERGGERPLRGRGVVHVVGGDHVDARRRRDLGQRVVAVPVERIAVVPQLDEHAVASEGGDEPVERAPGRGGPVVERARAGTVPLRHPVSTNHASLRTRRGAAQVNRRPGGVGERTEIEARARPSPPPAAPR